MSARLMTNRELLEFYQMMGMQGQCVVVNGKQMFIKGNILPEPQPLPQPQKPERPNDP